MIRISITRRLCWGDAKHGANIGSTFAANPKIATPTLALAVAVSVGAQIVHGRTSSRPKK
jgi:hypothetical protein